MVQFKLSFKFNRSFSLYASGHWVGWCSQCRDHNHDATGVISLNQLLSFIVWVTMHSVWIAICWVRVSVLGWGLWRCAVCLPRVNWICKRALDLHWLILHVWSEFVVIGHSLSTTKINSLLVRSMDLMNRSVDYEAPPLHVCLSCLSNWLKQELDEKFVLIVFGWFKHIRIMRFCYEFIFL